jgi:uncharacterized repeat protein (TIGR03803 family)
MTRIQNYRMFATALLAMILTAAISVHAQTYSVLYNFGNGDGLYNPFGVIAQGEDGSLYSTTGGGTQGYGAAFRITLTGKLTVLHSFCSETNCADGDSPTGLTLRPDGHFLGTTEGNFFLPTVYDMSQTGTVTTLASNMSAPLSSPQAPPILGADGSFYGTDKGGGPDCGTVYKISGASTTVFEVLHNFDGTHGCLPSGPLALGTDGNLYGTTLSGGAADAGVVFRLMLRPGKSPVFTVLANFDGVTLNSSLGALVQGPDGNFYGTAQSSAFGAVFKITPSGTLSVLHSFNGTTDGAGPGAGLALATDGNFYGTTGAGGSTSGACANGGCGTLFRVTPAGSFSVLHTFAFNDGAGNQTAPVQHTNGMLYGDGNGGTGGGVFYRWSDNLPPFVSTVQLMGAVGSKVEILGQGFTAASVVSFNGVAATATIQSGTSLWTVVPAGATTGFVTVTTSTGTLTSNKQFIVLP